MTMQPPITHYKDEPVDQTTENLVNQEIEKEVSAAAETKKVEDSAKAETTPELKVLPSGTS